MVIKIHVSPIGRVPKYMHQEMRDAIDGALEEEAQKIDDHWDTIFSSFENRQPSMFTSKVKKIGYDREIWVYTARATVSNGILSIMNFGLGPRPITSVSPKQVMVFPREYSAATVPGRIFSQRRKKHGDIWHTRHVRSHTIRARRFDLAIVKRRKGYFKRIVQNRIKKVAKRMFV